MKKVGVIGAGASGLMCAGYAAELGADVTLFDKNRISGRKLLITGKGRCNVTNACGINTLIENVPTNPRFLYASVNAFTPADTMAFFEGLSVPLKVERGNRVFPVSDRSADIVNALRLYVKRGGVKFVCEKVLGIKTENQTATGVICASREYDFDAVIVATGGKSYPLTGSDGDGYKFARELSIDVTEISAALVPLECREKYCAEMQGLSLKNVSIEVINAANGNVVYSDFGEMMFTHFGVTGPMILSASSRLGKVTAGKYTLKIDLKPALDMQTLDARILSDFEKNKNRDFANSLSNLLPAKMIPVIIKLSEISPHKKVNEITKEERRRLLELLKGLPFTISGKRPVDEAIITSGGINVKELNPKTMETKKIKNLYFIGEVIDVDAYTGGFNLQIAFSTARAAAVAVAE